MEKHRGFTLNLTLYTAFVLKNYA